jgi:hypothetical protein
VCHTVCHMYRDMPNLTPWHDDPAPPYAFPASPPTPGAGSVS